MIKKLLVLLFLLSDLNITSAQAPSFITDSLDAYIKRGMEQWQIPGLAIAIVKDGNVILEKGYGVKTMNKPDKVDENTLFIIASNSKLFTGTAMAKLDYEKRLSLNDKVTKHIPWFRMWDSTSTKLVTLKDMLSHRVGTKTFQGDFTFWDSNLPKDSIVWKMRYLKPPNQFRQEYGYCNAGFLVNGQVLKNVTGKTWETYVEENILNPLGMSNTYMNTAGMAARKNVATPHSNTFGPLSILPYDNVDNLGPATSMVGNVHDITKWLKLQLDSGRYEGKRILPWEVLQKTRDANTIVNSRKNANYPTHFVTYGLGVLSTDYNGKQVYWHTGGAFGFVTNVCFVPEEKLGITILTNNDNQSFFEALRYQILDAYLNVPYKDRSKVLLNLTAPIKGSTGAQLLSMRKRVEAKAAPQLPLEAYTGDFYNTVYGKITLEKNNKNQLICKFQHHPNMVGILDYMDNNEFRLTFSNIAYGISPAKFIIQNGKVQSVQIKPTDFVEYDAYLFSRNPDGLMVK